MEQKPPVLSCVVTLPKVLGAVFIWTAVTTLVVLSPDISPWITTPLVLIGLILIPGYLLKMNLRMLQDDPLEEIIYSIGLGMGLLLIEGLFFNWSLPYLGISHPLAKVPLIISFDLTITILALRAYFFNKFHHVSYEIGRTNKVNMILGIMPWVFVVTSICGAEILNNGGAGILTLITIFAIVAYFLLLSFQNHKVGSWVYVSALYSISLSLLLMYSLRSNHIFGWDINLEYRVFQTTLQNLRWKMSYYPGLDYNACVSITILPTIIKELTNIASEYVYKISFQLLFAVLPIVVYAFARRYMEKLFAFFAAILFAVQPWFFEQMPALNRQEIAFIAFAMVLFVIFDPRLGKKIKQILLYFFVAMLLVAHYSTFYVWVALIIAVFAVSGIMYPFKRLRQPFRIITPAVFIMSLIGIFIWQFFLTNTAGHLQEVITNQASTSTISTTTSGSAATQSNSSIRGGAETALYVGINSNTTESLTLAEQSAINSDLSVEGYETYPASSTATYNPTLISEPINAPTIIPGYINSFINILILLSRFIATELLPIIGILWLLWIFQKHRDDDRREDLGVFGLGAILIIGIMVLVPYLQTYYNLTRLYLQMFLILSTLAIIGGIAATRYIPHRRVLILSILMAIVLCGSSGALDQLIGGEKSMIFDQPPANLDAPYIYDGEVSSAMWLTANYNPNDPVQADIISNLRLQSFSKIDTFNFDIFPATIEPQSYVYLDKKNIQGEAFYQYNNNLLTYSYPLDFLNSQKNLIYNNGDSRIYH